ncbi:hypothetical protein TURU_106993 [Turdus rufiventris]|nr:hypothetical protein TURU_106993 [Turdus rufiventris]
MAALERPVPSPEAFLGQPWAAWVREAAPPHAHGAAPPHSVDLEETGKEGGKSREVMRLNKEVKSRYLAKSRSPVSNGKACLGVYNIYRNICDLHSSNLRTELSANFEIRGSFSSEFAFGSKELAE